MNFHPEYYRPHPPWQTFFTVMKVEDSLAKSILLLVIGSICILLLFRFLSRIYKKVDNKLVQNEKFSPSLIHDIQ